LRNYIIKRLLLGAMVLMGVVVITFFLARIIPSNPAAQWVGPRATQEQIDQATIDLGLDKPLYVQFGKYIQALTKGDLGKSLRSKQPVSTELAAFLPPTIELIIFSTILAILIGIPLGLNAAKRRDQALDHFCRFFSVGAVSLPTFWVALFLQLIFFSILGILPLGGQMDTKIKLLYTVQDRTGFLLLDSILSGNWIVAKDVFRHMILPAVTIALYPIGLVARMTRSALLEILSEDYIKAARSYGIKERIVLWNYALKNSLGTTVTVLALSIGYTLVNTFLVEAIFSWPGIGRYIATAVVALDYPAIIGVTLVSAFAYIMLNLFADIIIALDPRVRV
jgi:peptide/nickel transport system permease protein